jgi:hypothetical protein
MQPRRDRVARLLPLMVAEIGGYGVVAARVTLRVIQ